MKCLYPQRKRRNINGFTTMYEHACGQCEACRITRRAAWKSRILLEANEWTHASFVTLTYNEDNLPIGLDWDAVPQGVLVKDELSKFFKRLRKNTRQEIRHFSCGEYGDRGDRPHYHSIIYGHNSNDISSIERAWSKDGEPIGIVDCQPISTARAGYVAKYTLKRLGSTVQDIGTKPSEFALMSRGGKGGYGIGLGCVGEITDSIYRTSVSAKEPVLEIFRRCFKSISIGGRSLPVHPTLKRKVYEEIIKRETKGGHDREKLERKYELKKYVLNEQQLVIEGPIARMVEEEDRKQLADRKLRKSNRTVKL